MNVLELHGLTKEYQKEGGNGVLALRGVDLTIEKGEFLAIMGPSGSGKTTLLNIIGCLDTPTGGGVVYNGRPLGQLPETELSQYRKENIAFIFQSYNLIPVLTVQENVELPLVLARRWSATEMAQKARAVLGAVGLAGMERRYPRELSGGQEQRVAIARALVKDPLLVLADEPTANLDSQTAEEIMQIMRRLNRERQSTFVFSTHDKLVESHARRVIVLKDGRVDRDERR